MVNFICSLLDADYTQTAISYPIAVLSHWRMALQSVTPSLTILLAFAAFIAWNEGVVLGTLTSV